MRRLRLRVNHFSKTEIDHDVRRIEAIGDAAAR